MPQRIQHLESVGDILEAELQGHREEVLEAVIDPLALEFYEISGEELISTIARNNRLVPAGSIDTGEGRFSVKVPSIIEEADDLFDLPVKTVDTIGAIYSISEDLEGELHGRQRPLRPRAGRPCSCCTAPAALTPIRTSPPRPTTWPWPESTWCCSRGSPR